MGNSELYADHLLTTLLCTLPGAKFVCSPTEVNTHRKVNLDHNQQSLETHQYLHDLCEECKDIYSLH